MVRLLDRLWSQIEPDLYLLREGSECVGLRLVDSEVTYIDLVAVD
jgi:hypothetical protein